jgi:hypothetical protein
VLITPLPASIVVGTVLQPQHRPAGGKGAAASPWCKGSCTAGGGAGLATKLPGTWVACSLGHGCLFLRADR